MKFGFHHQTLKNLFFIAKLCKSLFLHMNFVLEFFLHGRNSCVKMKFFKAQRQKTNFSKFKDKKTNFMPNLGTKTIVYPKKYCQIRCCDGVIEFYYHLKENL